MAKDDNKKKDQKKGAPKKEAPNKDTKKNQAPKVTSPKDKGQNDAKSKARSMLLKHPQITQNARGLFRNENGKTIVEEIVYRGDAKVPESIMPRNQGDLTDEDLRSLAVHASTLVDKNISKYDPVVASEDALNMSIRTKDGGKYDGKVSASTFQLILDNMRGLKKAADESGDDNQTAKQRHDEKFRKEDGQGDGEEKDPSSLERHKQIMEGVRERSEKRKPQRKPQVEESQVEESQPETNTEEPNPENTEEPNPENTEETPKEGTMDKRTLKKEREAMLRKLAALEELIDERNNDYEKEAGEEDQAKPRVPGGDPAEPEDNDTEGESKNPITATLDEIAGELEEQKDPELFKMAYQLDQISDILEGRKEAHTFESDPDEKFMKTFFKGGLHEGDSDEPYMKEFNTDITKEVNDVKDKKNGKEASQKLPYQKLA